MGSIDHYFVNLVTTVLDACLRSWLCSGGGCLVAVTVATSWERHKSRLHTQWHILLGHSKGSSRKHLRFADLTSLYLLPNGGSKTQISISCRQSKKPVPMHVPSYNSVMLALMVLLVVIGLMTFAAIRQERRSCDKRDIRDSQVRESFSKNNYGTTTVRDNLNIVQGGGGHPFVY